MVAALQCTCRRSQGTPPSRASGRKRKGGREPPTGCSGPFGPPPAFAATQTGHIHINRLHHVYRKQINTTDKDSGNRIARGRWDGASPEHRGRFAQPQAIRNTLCVWRPDGWQATRRKRRATCKDRGQTGGGLQSPGHLVRPGHHPVKKVIKKHSMSTCRIETNAGQGMAFRRNLRMFRPPALVSIKTRDIEWPGASTPPPLPWGPRSQVPPCCAPSSICRMP